jgi:hypothetical protein
MSRDAAAVTELFASGELIGLADLGDADLQCRTDVKYLVALPQLAELTKDLQRTHAVLCVDGLLGFSYRSTYVDTPELACYHAHRQGRRLRWKARTRLYADSGRCRFEVKLKTGRGATDKHALLLETHRYGTVPAEGVTLLQELLYERYGVAAPTQLISSLQVEHSRTTLVANDGASRLTLDSDLVFTSTEGTNAGLRDGFVLIETKSAAGRGPADQILRRAGVRPASVSKYSVGTALTRPELPDHPWRALKRHTFTADGHPAIAA